MVDFQVWVTDGDRPLPQRLVITYKQAKGEPQFWAQFSDWNLAPAVEDSMFLAKPPDGAQKLAFAAQLPRVSADGQAIRGQRSQAMKIASWRGVGAGLVAGVFMLGLVGEVDAQRGGRGGGGGGGGERAAAVALPRGAAASLVAAALRAVDFPPVVVGSAAARLPRRAVVGSAAAGLPRRAVAGSAAARLPRKAVAGSAGAGASSRLQRVNGKARPPLRRRLLSRAGRSPKRSARRHPARIRPSARTHPARTKRPGNPRQRTCKTRARRP